MRVRYRNKPDTVGTSERFNPYGTGEVIVRWDGDMSSEYIRDLEVEIGDKWKSLTEAFKDKDLITDNHNRRFFEPKTQEDRERGYTV